MIGNDIVDLTKAKQETDIFRSRYLEKVCLPLEIRLVLAATDPVECFWRIWTMKESAYKAVQRQFNLKPIFNPSAFTCVFENSEVGTVYFRDQQLFTKTLRNEDFVYSEILDSEHTHRFFGADSDFLLQVKNELDLPLLPEFIKTGTGLPILKWADKTLPVSKTHHGIFQVFQY
ncbi:4-phosphopantetheinyl transferase family protein [Psychroflexus sp. YR1-1]|uniref:4-phosphopantetheinyl transferase family protein n=1 Tax=Psychroflexus aurantiacus TaxID=2709310 RepID=A0A6B3R198_9FLAO|nr:4'-phosphopantetheinyl transferase superfamily protein [Psychroflexus aurantiacus]NEV93190.1 4-phosphopantetheinyl transferase family protein [Psychroflexus aurantiacus]